MLQWIFQSGASQFGCQIYVAKISHFADLTTALAHYCCQPITTLTSKNGQWLWGIQHICSSLHNLYVNTSSTRWELWRQTSAIINDISITICQTDMANKHRHREMIYLVLPLNAKWGDHLFVDYSGYIAFGKSICWV